MNRRSHNEPTSDPARAVWALADLACRTFEGELSPREEAGLVTFERTIARRTLQGGGRRAWAYGIVFAAAAAGVAVASMTLHPLGQTLTFDVVGGKLGDGGYVRAGSGAGAQIRFSDGSNLALAPGTSTRVTDLGPNGGRVFLESGQAHVQVKHRARTRWTVEAGPYSVRVVGTEFDIHWSEHEELFDVHLRKGSIIVSGPLANRGLAMEAGQRLVANVKQGEIFLDRDPAAAPSAPAEGDQSPPASTPAAGPVGAAPESEIASESARGPAHPGPGPSVSAAARGGRRAALALPGEHDGHDGLVWSKLVAAGDFLGVLADAERRGLDLTLSTAAVGDLAALADAARYVRRGDVARRALLAERNRFPKSREGREAAFFLGGISEDELGPEASTEALTWYDRYLDESPKGAYAANALGREMVLVQKLRGQAAARLLAERYLELFPNGPYNTAARKLTEER